MDRLSPRCIKLFKTCNLYLCFFILGLCVAVPGPCLLDLENLVHTSTQQIAFIYTARSVGFLIGSVIGGIVLDAVKSKQIVLTACNFVVALSTLAVPWSRNLGTLTAFMVINGVARGTVDVGGNVVCLTLWGSDSGPFYQALHFSFGLGGLVAPLIAAPFLGDFSVANTNVSVSQENTTSMYDFMNSTTEFQGYNNYSALSNSIPNIVYPFTIIGIFGLLVSFMFLFVCIICPVEESKKDRETSQYVKTDFRFLSPVVFFCFLLLFLETGTEVGYAQMLTTYVVKGRLQLPTSTGSFMTSTFWAAFTTSRLASVFLAIKVSNFTLIVCDLIITSAGSVVLLFLASYEWAMWLASVLLGVGIASFFPAVVAWLGTYITATNKIVSVVMAGAAVGEMVIPLTISHYIETAPDVLIYVVPISIVCSNLIVFVMYMIFRKREKKIMKGIKYSIVGRQNAIA